MKKRILLFLFIAFSFALSSNAQETVAKIKFGEAEQAFANNDFQTTIAKLDEAEKLLNQSNSKILHLRIKAEYGILQQDPWARYDPIEKLRNKCKFYLKEYDGKAPMDKYMEVYNVSEGLKTYPASTDEFNKAKEEKIRKEQETTKIQRESKNKQIVEDMTQRIKSKKKDHDAYYQRGKAKNGLDDKNGAVEDLSMAIKLDSTNDTYYFYRGYVYYFRKEYSKAVEDYTKAILLNPKKENYFNYRAKAYYQLNDYVKTTEDYSQAIQLNSQSSYYNFWRGYTYYNMKEYSKAVIDFTNAIKLDPTNINAYSYRGKTYYQFLNDKLKAEADFKKVIELKDNLSGLDAFANYYLGNKALGIKILEDNYSTAYNKSLWSYQLACIYSLDHNKEESLKYLKIAFEKYYDVHTAIQDEDLEFIRNTPEFKALKEQYGTKK